MIDPSQARYRSAVAMHKLAKFLGVQLDPAKEDCECLERLAIQAERWQSYRWYSREEIADERTSEDWRRHAE